tara:strand:- start:121 stop:909 length:789 start_codon:yes stop_codon:yes gene_type:complete
MFGTSFGNSASSGGVAFDSSALSIFSQMTTNGSTPSDARKVIINQLVLDLKGTGNHGSADVWSLIDVLSVFGADDSIQALTEWKSADGSLDASVVGTPTFIANSGYSSTIVSNRIVPGWRPNPDGVQYTQNNASIGINGAFTLATYILGNVGVTHIRLRPNSSPSDNRMHSSANGFLNWNNTSSGLFVLDRTSSAAFKGYSGATDIGSVNATSIAPPTSEIRMPYAFASGSANLVKIFFAGASTITHRAQINDSFNAYIAAI